MPNRNKREKAVVTGATGFVGANIVRALVKRDFEVHILIRKQSNLWRIQDILSQITPHRVDLLEEKLLQKTMRSIQPEVIFHLANAPLYQGIHSLQKEYINTNIVGTINLLDACDTIPYKCFINTGSSAEYGTKVKPMRENDFCHPLSLYAITKLASTNYASFTGKIENKPVITFRLFSPYGPYDDPKRLITEVIYNALENKPIHLSDPNVVRDYIYIEDVIHAYLLAIKKAEKYNGEIFNIGSGKQTSIDEVVKTIIKVTNSTSKIKWGALKGRLFESKAWQADIEKTKESLHWVPSYSFLKGINETISWFTRNLNFYKGKVREFS